MEYLDGNSLPYLAHTLYVSRCFSSTISIGMVGKKLSAMRIIGLCRKNKILLYLSFVLYFLYLLLEQVKST